MSRIASLAALAACAVSVAPARAGTIAAAEVGYDAALLSNFNLVTLGNMTVSSPNGAQIYDQGRVIVGGNLTVGSGVQYGACSQISNDNCPGNATVAVDASGGKYGALTVFGNVSNGGYLAAGYNSGGTAYVRGSMTGTFAANGRTALNVAGSTSGGMNVDSPTTITTSSTYAGTTTTTAGKQVVASASTVFPFNSTKLTGEIKGLAAGIAALPGTPGVKSQSITMASQLANGFVSKAENTASSGKTFDVISTTMTALTGQKTLTINPTGADTTYIIVSGDLCSGCLLPTLNSYTGQSKVIFDFVDAKSLMFSGVWNSSILAPLATLTQNGAIDGTIIVNAISQSAAITANNLFTSDLPGLIPEPASMALLGGGAVAAGLMRRRRKAG